MIYQLNMLFSLAIFSVTLWAVFNSKVHSGVIGTTLLAFASLAALVNTQKPTLFGLLPQGAAVTVTALLALISVLCVITHKDPRKKCHPRIFDERRKQ